MEISNCVNKNVAIEKINAVQPKLNAVVTMVDEADNTKEGKLSGVPVALKDNISTCGIRTTASSRILDNYVPVYDATIVKKLREAGADFVCKASMDELGMGGTNKNAYTGAVHNPYDLDRIPGGKLSALSRKYFIPMITKPSSFLQGFLDRKSTRLNSSHRT